MSVSDSAKGHLEHAYVDYGMLSHGAVHPTVDVLRRHFRVSREGGRQIAQIVPPFKQKERLATIDMACEALFGVCVGVNELLEGTSQNDALRALVEQFVRQGNHAY